MEHHHCGKCEGSSCAGHDEGLIEVAVDHQSCKRIVLSNLVLLSVDLLSEELVEVD